ncbi:glycosyltransferase family 4 protein, partial [Enterococcus faecium]|nr:glycosyltransferase family 4 protein [Enterococcus faecium]
MKKDVLFMCQFFYPEYISSALLPFQTAEALKDSGLSVDVLCGFPKEYIKDNSKVPLHETVDGINIYRKKYLQLSRSNFFGRIVNYFSFTFMMLMNILKC